MAVSDEATNVENVERVPLLWHSAYAANVSRYR